MNKCLLLLVLFLSSCATFKPSIPGNKSDPPIYADSAPLLEFPKTIKPYGGDCAVWATEVNGRRVGIIKNDAPLDQETWDLLRVQLGTKTTGTNSEVFHKYWKDNSFDIFLEPVKDCESYATLARAMKSGCIAFREFFTKTNGGHVEAILDVVGEEKTCFIKTNSWGKKSMVTGFSNVDVNHANFKMYSGNDVVIVDFIACKKL